jgi:hypothetical protein
LGTADRAGAPPIIAYGLDDSSVFVQGCFPAGPIGCAGPLMLTENFTGAFGTTVAGTDPDGFDLTLISDMTLVAMLGSQPIVVQGNGLYRRNQLPDAQQQLTLNALVNGEPVVFDSGLVPVPDSPHAIDISVSINNLQNYDTLMVIVADPITTSRARSAE